jgi:Ca2+-binding RTX toxin-like protein
VFGKAGGFSANLDLSALDGTNGFRLDGIDAGDYAGHSVSSAGDINGDGFDDIIIGAYRGDPGGDANAGESYVVFGKAGGFAASLDLSTLNGTNGFRIDGIDAGDQAGISVASAGDINGDGFDDIIIGAWLADPGSDTSAGESYVVFGKAGGFSASLDLSTLNGTNGFRLDGIDRGDGSGFSVSSAGDFNGDGFDDILVSAYGGDPGGDAAAGETYIVFGKAGGFSAALDLAALNGSNGFRIEGIDVGDQSGISVSAAGDINGDGFDDIIIGAVGGDPGTDSAAGESYILFGAASIADPFQGTAGNDTINGTGGADTIYGRGGNDTLNGAGGNDVLYGGTGNDTANGGDGNDRIFGGTGNDKLNGGAGNDVIFGGAGGDILKGDAGSDRFVYSQVADSLAATGQRDFILAFERGSDKIDLSQIDAIPGGADNAFSVVTAFTGTAGQIVLTHADGITRASIDADGDGVGEMLIAIKSAAALTASDFIL